jgi:hypothetical protein
VRARTTEGRTASASAKADVQPRAAIPDALVGTFTRTVSDRDMRRTADARGSEEGPPTGTWTMHLDRKGLVRFDDPEGSGGAEAVTVEDGTMTFYGAPDWVLPEDRQGGFCEPTGPAAYEWTASKGGVKLRSGHDRKCPDRDAIFAGTWTRKR